MRTLGRNDEAVKELAEKTVGIAKLVESGPEFFLVMAKIGFKRSVSASYPANSAYPFVTENSASFSTMYTAFMAPTCKRRARTIFNCSSV